MKTRNASIKSLAIALLCAVTIAPQSAIADVKLPSIFSSHMVIQRDAEAPVWGWADAGEKVVVEFNGQHKETAAGDDGKWMVKLTPMKASTKPQSLHVVGKNTIKLDNVLIGEVWVCSGQSNMAWTVSRSDDADLEALAAKNSNIRLITVPRVPAHKPADDFEGAWVVCSPETAPNFSAVGYFFGRQLQQTLGVPVGLINTSWGGTPAESWTHRKDMEAQAKLKPLLQRWDEQVEKYDAEKAKASYEKQLAVWKTKVEEAKKTGKRWPRRPRLNDPTNSSHRPANLYNGMIAPLQPLAIRGGIWYQGESNASRAEQYRTVFPTMIQSWRTRWQKAGGNGDFSFYWVQLANFRAREAEPGDSDWAELREAQSMTRKLPKTGEAVIIDIGQARDIHPTDKQNVAKRLARHALKNDYGYDIVHASPRYKAMEVKNGKAVITFDHVGAGLRGYDRATELIGFAIAGKDKQWQWAKARVVGKDKVAVWHDAIKEPVAVRYGWAANPEVNLQNSVGLPASPFRTDDWPMVTAGKH